MATMNHGLADAVMDATGETLEYLRERWRDEHGYEKWSDYVFPIRKALKKMKGVMVLGMTKRPFGFNWQGPDGGQRWTGIMGQSIRTKRTDIAAQN